MFLFICLQAFCNSIRQYLASYRVAVLSVQDTMNPLALLSYIKELQEHVTYLAAFCHIGPFQSSDTMPCGIQLLNDLYENVMNLTSQNILTVLYSVLYSCCEVYFKWVCEVPLFLYSYKNSCDCLRLLIYLFIYLIILVLDSL